MQKIRILISVLVALAAFLCASVYCAEGLRGMFRGGPRQTGEYNDEGPAEKPRIQWTFDAGAKLSNPILSNGVLVVSTATRIRAEEGTLKGCVLAVDTKTGNLLWKSCASKAPVRPPAIVDNMVVFGTVEGDLHFLRLDNGAVIARQNVGSAVTTAIVVSEDHLYFATDDGYVHSYSVALDEVWKLKVAERDSREPEFGNIWCAPAVSDDVLYVSATGQFLQAIELEEKIPVWKIPLRYGEHVFPVVAGPMASGGNVIFLTDGGTEYWCVDGGQGHKIWDFPVAQPSGAVAGGGSVYVNDGRGHVCVLDIENGKEKWNVRFESRFLNMSLGAKRLYVVELKPGLVHAIDRRTGQRVWTFGFGKRGSGGTPVVAEGGLYIAVDKELWALREGSDKVPEEEKGN